MTEPYPPQIPAPPAGPPPAAPGYPQVQPPATGALVTEQKAGPGLLIRALWFVFIGWWLTAIVSAVAWFAMITIIGLPLGIWMINRIPTVLTLRPRTSYLYATTDQWGRTTMTELKIEQPSWVIRGIWFIFVGWWASALVMSLGYALCLLIITLPVGLMLFNRVPAVASLYRY